MSPVAAQRVLEGPCPPFTRLDLAGSTAVDAESWFGAHAAELRTDARKHGAVWIRGFAPMAPERFARAVSSAFGPLIDPGDRSTPRTEVAAKVFTATDHPADQSIPLHNENSYASTWPDVLCFHCGSAAASGGQTVLADTRRVLQRLPDRLVEAWRRRRIRYVRNYIRGIGLEWTTAFAVRSAAELEEACRAGGYSCSWSGEGRLRLTRVADAVATHPATGEDSWFNHALFYHRSSLPEGIREVLTAMFDPADMPNATSFGDGDEFPEEDLAIVRQAYAAEARDVAWRAGDILLVDNLLMAHGRKAFTGQRRIIVTMTREAAA